jgi:hypothetical protein
VVKAKPRPLYPRQRPGARCYNNSSNNNNDNNNSTKQSLSSQTDSRITTQKYPTSYKTRTSTSVLTSTRQWTLFWIALSHPIYVSSFSILSSNICSCLRHCGTSRKVAVPFADGVTGIFHPSGRTLALGPTSNRN